ncbi:unnamed protein product [Caenorhabditis brenneri]
MPKPKFIRRIQDWFSKSKSDLPKTEQPVFVPSVPPVNTIPSKPLEKFPILLLPFVAQKKVLWMLKLNDLIPLSFLSKRSKRMIKQALPSKKAQYNCTVWTKDAPIITISSRFGSYTGYGPDVDHIIEVLSYPPIRVVVEVENAVTRAAEWVKTHQYCVKEVAYLTRSVFLNDEHIVEYVNQFIEFNVRIEANRGLVIDRGLVIVRSQEEILIDNPDFPLMKYFWRLKCRKIRIIDRIPPFLAEMFLFILDSSDIGESSIVEQMTIELEEHNELNWILLRNRKKMEEDLQHPIYGKINEYYKIYHESRKVILFETHHDGKKLLVVDIEQCGLFEHKHLDSIKILVRWTTHTHTTYQHSVLLNKNVGGLTSLPVSCRKEGPSFHIDRRFFFLSYAVVTTMPIPKTEAPVLVAPDTTPPKKKFPILRLPFFARKNVLLRLKLDDLIPLSLLSKQYKRMIKQALPSKKAKYKCRVWPKEVSSIKIYSRFGTYTGFEPNVDHIIEVLSYPPIKVVIDGEGAVFHAIEWVNTHQHCVKEVLYLSHFCSINYGQILEFINQLIELNARIEFDRGMVSDRGMVIAGSQKEILIDNPTTTFIPLFWRLNCRKIRIVDRHPPYLTEMFLSSFSLFDIGESSMIEQLIFELKECREINWTRLRNCKKCEEELLHPIYGKINEYYKTCHVSRKVILFETHHDGKKLMVVDIKHCS